MPLEKKWHEFLWLTLIQNCASSLFIRTIFYSAQLIRGLDVSKHRLVEHTSLQEVKWSE